MATDEVLPGGLVLLTKVPNLDIKSYEQELYEHLVKSQFDLKYFDNLSENLREGAKTIVSALKNVPQSISTYVTLHRILNRLEYTFAKVAADEATCHASVDDEYEGEGQKNYEITVSAQFFDMNALGASATIHLRPLVFSRTRESARGHRNGYHDADQQYIKAKIVSLDYEEKVITITPLYNRYSFDGNLQSINKETQYIVSFEPSSYDIRARESILLMLKTGVQNKTDYLVFPAKYTPLHQIGIAGYKETEEELLQEIPFKSPRFNTHQKKAIFAILNDFFDPSLPYILHGPPGTGKTTTLVEAVRLLLIADRQHRILICTPSNTAADLIAIELLASAGISRKKLFRMYSLTKPVEEQPPELKDVSCIVDQGFGRIYGIHPADKLLKYRIIVSTLTASSYLTNGGMHGHFTHIIVDEAGQATEQENLIPLVGLKAPNTKIVLAGDPKQLGPVVTVNYFQKNNLKQSLIERLYENEHYKDDPRTMCMLTESYRSHPDIIQLPSEMFYQSRLIQSPDSAPKDTLINWERLPKKGTPLFWHHCANKETVDSTRDETVQGGHSFCNYGEADIIISYVKQIMTDLGVKPCDIGIVTPYKLQVCELRNKVRDNGIEEIMIDTVERFQGSERRVILISLVRSTKKIGFLVDARRFCTTLTRAMELLIVVGNHEVMSADKCWDKFINYCKGKGAVIGISTKEESTKTSAPTENGATSND